MDVDRLAAVGEGGCATRTTGVIVDSTAIDHGTECPDVTRRGWVELRSLDGRGTPLSMPPLLGVVALGPGQPLFAGGKAPLIPSKGSPLPRVPVLQGGLLSRLA